MTDSTTGGATAQSEPWCDHIFMKIREADKTADKNPPPGIIPRTVAGIIAGCAWCGQIRSVFEDGDVKIIFYGKSGIPAKLSE